MRHPLLAQYRFLPAPVLILLLLLFVPGAVAQQVAVPEEAATVGLDEILPVTPRVKIGTLSNGLRYYVRENERPENRAELRLVVNVGSIVEDEDQLGLAHFVEHMSFNGTEHFQKQELVDFLESLGMQFGPAINAGTSFDETTYMLRVPTEDPDIVDKAFLVLEDWAHGVSFDHDEIDKERGVIVEEWRLGRGAGARIRDKQFPILFKDSHYAVRLPIGDPEIIQNFEYETLKRFYRDWYRPDLMAVVAVGDFDAVAIEEMIRSHFERVPAATNPRPRQTYGVPDHAETLFAIAVDPEATSTSVAVYWKQPLREQQTVGAYRQGMVERLYNGMLNRRLSELTQLADPPYLGAGSSQGMFIRSKEIYTLSAGVDDEGIERGLEAILIEAERVARHGFTASEMERQKTSLLRSMERSFTERDKSYSSGYAAEYIRSFLQGEPIPGIEYEYELYKRFVPEITLTEVNRLAREWITDSNRVIMVDAPEKEGLEIPGEAELLAVFAAAAAAEVTPYEDTVGDEPLVALPPEPVEILSENRVEDVDVTEWELANGVRVILKPTDFQEDQIVFSAFSPGGSSLVADQDIIPASTATLVVSSGGLGDYNAIELQKKLTGKVANVSPVISELEEGLSGSASPKDIETLFQLIYLTFTAPRADEVIFQSLQTRFRAMLENMGASPIMAFSDTLAQTLASYHPRVRPMSDAVLDDMNLEESFAFYQDRFADASDFTFIFVGNLDLEVIRPLVQRYLGGLPSIGRKETWRDVGIDYPKGVIEKTVRKGLEPQSQTVIIFTGPHEYGRKNNYALSSMTSVLEIMLREKIREELGGTYGVSLGQSVSRIPDQEYSITINFGSDPERVDELTAAVFAEIERLKTEGPSEENLQKVLESQRRSRETGLKQNGFWQSQIALWYRQDESPSQILTYDQLFDTLDAEMVRQAAIRHFDMENYVRVTLMPEGGAGGRGL
jgi:zinc protease